MSDGATISAPARAWETAAARQQIERRVVVDVTIANDAAVAMAGVFAETDIGDDDEVRCRVLERTHCVLHDAGIVVRLGTFFVLRCRQPEDQHRGYAKRLEIVSLARYLVERDPKLARHRLDLFADARAVGDEQGIHEVGRRQPRFGDQAPHAGRLPQAAVPGEVTASREIQHRSSVTLEGSPPALAKGCPPRGRAVGFWLGYGRDPLTGSSVSTSFMLPLRKPARSSVTYR